MNFERVDQDVICNTTVMVWTKSDHYGISIQKSLPHCMQTDSHKKNIALKQMKEAFFKLSVDQLNQNELQELIKTSTHSIISRPNLLDSSGIDIPGQLAQSSNLPASSHMMKLSSQEEQSDSKNVNIEQSVEGITRRRSQNSSSKSSHGIFKKRFARVTAGSSHYKLKRSSQNEISPSQWNVESGYQNLDAPSFQSSIRLRCSNTAKSFSSSNSNVKESVIKIKDSQIYKLEDFVKLKWKDDHACLKENSSLEEFEASIPNTSHDSVYTPKTFVGLCQDGWSNPDQMKWMFNDESTDDQKEHGNSQNHKQSNNLECNTFKDNKPKPRDAWSATAEHSDITSFCNVEAEQSDKSISCCVKQEHSKTESSVSCISKQSDTSASCSVRVQKSDQLSTPSALQHAVTAQSDTNNSAMVSRTNIICPIKFEANIKSFGFEMNINNHAVSSSTGPEKHKTSPNIDGTSVDKPTNSVEKIIKIWSKTDCNTPLTVKHKRYSSSHNWQPTESEVEEKDLLNAELIEKDEMLTGKAALEHYLLFIALEKAVQLKKLDVIKEDIVSDYQWKIEIVNEIYQTAKSYYCNPSGEARKKWKNLRKSISQQSKYSIMDIRDSLAKFGWFLPIFTYLIIVVQVMSCSLLCSLFGITHIGLEPMLEFKSKVQTFLGHETIHRWTIPNVWIGVSMHSLIAAGAVFGLCMRDNIHTRIAILHTHNFSRTDKLGCCEIASRNTAGTTTHDECFYLSAGVGHWHENIPCDVRISGENSVANLIKPCCIDMQGVCIHTSHIHCLFVGGIFHQRGVHCSQVNCANDICKLGGLSPDPDQPWLSLNANQWGRLFLNLFYTHGIIHALLVVVGNWVIARQLETSIGWLRMLIIYCCCGINGSLCAAIFSPYTPQVGSTASLMGNLGVITVELTQGWPLIHRPWIELAKIFAVILFSLFLGSLPLVNNYAIVTGFLTGIICAVAFLPYITFGQWNKHCRIILCVSALIILFITHCIFLYMFHYVQDLSTYCESCHRFNCLPYLDNMCDDKLLYYDDQINNFVEKLNM